MGKKIDISFSYKLFNPLFYHLMKLMKDDDIRIVLSKGGSSSGKSYSSAQASLVSSLKEGCNILVLRKIGSTIRRSIFMDFETIIKRSSYLRSLFEVFQNEIRNKINGSRIDFSGLDDSEKIKGISQYKYIILDELTEFDYEDYKQLRKRMRGIKGQKMICNFNPISELHWIKKLVVDTETWEDDKNYISIKSLEKTLSDCSKSTLLTEVSRKQRNSARVIINPRTGEEEYHPSDMVMITTTYLNNFWVVGSPDGRFGFYDRQTIADFEKDKERDYDYYRIYALAEWGVIKTGGEFLYNFDEKRNCAEIPYNSLIPIRLSVDNNVLPYISIGFWQLDGDNLLQIHEIAAEEPNNTVSSAAFMACEYLESIGYNDVVIIHADSSTAARNTIDERNKSFIDKFADVMSKFGYKVILSMPKKNPSVSMSCEFVNKLLFDGRIKVNRSCKKSIMDYLNSKRDSNGGMMKKRVRDKSTGQTYEQFGHFTDTLRYVGTYAFSKEYVDFSAVRRSNPVKESDYKFYDKMPSGEWMNYTEIYPNINGSMVIISSVYTEGKIFIGDILLTGKYKSGIIPENMIKGETCIVVNPSNINAVREMRSLCEGNENIYVKGRRDKGRHMEKVDSWIPFIKENVLFSKDISEDALNSILDYDGTSSYEVLAAISTMCERITKENRKEAA